MTLKFHRVFGLIQGLDYRGRQNIQQSRSREVYIRAVARANPAIYRAAIAAKQ